MKFRAYLITGLVALLFFNSSCVEDRSESELSPQKALLGHWIREGDDRQYYFSERGITETNANGKILEQGFYTVLKQDSFFIREIVIEAQFKVWTSHRTFRFTKDGTKMVETVYIDPMSPLQVAPSAWFYVDNKQQP